MVLSGMKKGAYIVVGIAANSDDHMNVLASLADAIEDPEEAKTLSETSVDKIFDLYLKNP